MAIEQKQKPETKQRLNAVFSAEERDRFEKVAQAKGASINDWVRQTLLKATSERTAIVEFTEEEYKILKPLAENKKWDLATLVKDFMEAEPDYYVPLERLEQVKK
jgi:uncharacterized protein (DUF1778 family)